MTTRRISSSALILGITLLLTGRSWALQGADPLNPIATTLLRSATADDRVSYDGVFVTAIRSPRIDFRAEVHVVHDHVDPSLDRTEVLRLFLDGEEIDAESEGVEEIWVPRPFLGPQGMAPGTMSQPPAVPDSYPNFHVLRRFEIRDAALFLRNYRLRDLGAATMFGRPVRILEALPVDPTFSGYRLRVDTATGLILRSDVSFPGRNAVEISHYFTEITIGASQGEEPPMAASIGSALPDAATLARLEASARALLPGFALPDELPEGCRIEGIEERRGSNSDSAVVVRLTNGVESFFIVARRPIVQGADPVTTGLARIAAELGLDTVPPEVRSKALESLRPRVERIVDAVRQAEKEARRGLGSRATVAWKETRLGVTRLSIFTSRLDLLAVGQVPTPVMIEMAEGMLNAD